MQFNNTKAVYQQQLERQLAFSGPEPTWDGLRLSENICCAVTSPHFKLFLEIMDVVSSGLKRKRSIQILISPWACSCPCVPWKSVKAPWMQKALQFYRAAYAAIHAPPFFRDNPAHLRKLSPGLIKSGIGWPACSPGPVPLNMCAALSRRNTGFIHTLHNVPNTFEFGFVFSPNSNSACSRHAWRLPASHAASLMELVSQHS